MRIQEFEGFKWLYGFLGFRVLGFGLWAAPKAGSPGPS